MAGSKRKLLVHSNEVDTVFSCSLCKVRAYTDNEAKRRAMDPAKPDRELRWWRFDICENCAFCLTLCYRFDFMPSGRFAEYHNKKLAWIRMVTY